MLNLTFKLSKYLGFLLILITLNSCSSQDSKFNNELKQLFSSSKSEEINSRHKKLFDELYGWDKARKQGIEYCQMLSKGISKEEIRSNHIATGLELISQGKLTPEESADIDIINISIELAAQKVYCPEHRDVGQIPIRDRFK
ncbi:hypothetical protein ACQFX9_09350 [Aliinostoc sp. HNIBRCY26]|uniref:hypothetical protein n=1 Tax=Aliinostoc sp. HNIBRCY26 TaxID=3418997 RepID=UPI003D015D65